MSQIIYAEWKLGSWDTDLLKMKPDLWSVHSLVFFSASTKCYHCRCEVEEVLQFIFHPLREMHVFLSLKRLPFAVFYPVNNIKSWTSHFHTETEIKLAGLVFEPRWVYIEWQCTQHTHREGCNQFFFSAQWPHLTPSQLIMWNLHEPRPHWNFKDVVMMS